MRACRLSAKNRGSPTNAFDSAGDSEMLEPGGKTREKVFDISDYRAFLDALGIPLIIIDSQYNIAFINTAGKEKWGPVSGKRCYRALRKSLTACKDCPLEEVIRTKEPKAKRTRLPAGEEWHDYETVFVFLSGPIEGLSYVAVACKDVEEIEKLERTAISQKALSKALLDSAAEMVIGLDQTGRVKFANRAVQKVTGFPEDFVKTRGLKVLFPEDAVGAVDEMLRHPEVEASGSPTLIPIVSRSGERRMISWTLANLETDQKSPPGILLFGQDVTERYLYRKAVERRAWEVEIVNKILTSCSNADSQEKVLSTALQILVNSLNMRCGVSYIFMPELNAGRLVAQTGLSKATVPGTIDGSRNIFPASAVYADEVQAASLFTPMYEESRDVMLRENLKGLLAVPVKPKGYPAGLIVLGHDKDEEELSAYGGLLSPCVEAIELCAENVFLRFRAESRAREIESYYRVAKTLSETQSIKDTLSIMAREISKILKPDICSVYLYDERSEQLELEAVVGLSADEARDSPLLTLTDFKSVVFHGSEPLVLGDTDTGQTLPDYVEQTQGIRTRVMAPLILGGKTLGVLVLDEKRKRVYSSDELKMISAFAAEASSVLHGASLIEKIRASEEKYRTLVELSRDPVVMVDGTGRIIFTNSAGKSLVQKNIDEIIGTNILQYVAPDEVEVVAAALREVAYGKREWEQRDIRALINNEERIFEVTASLLQGKGEEAQLMLMLRDITERERTLLKLKESEERYRTLIERAGEAVIVADREGKISFANNAASEMFEIPREDFLGSSAFSLVHPDDRERVRADYEHNWQRGASVSAYRVRALRRDGDEFFVEVNSAFLTDLDGETRKILLIRDMTDKAQMERERERRLKAHEIVSNLAEKFVAMENLNDSIAVAVRDVAEFVRADRGYWAEVRREPLSAACKFEWTAVGIERVLVTEKGSEVLYPSVLEHASFGAGRVLTGSVEDIENPLERKDYVRRGAKTFALIPVFCGDEITGFVAFERTRESRDWDEVEKDLMGRLGETLSFAYEREKWVSEIRESENFRARIEQSIAEVLIVLRNGVIVWTNERVKDIYGYEPEEIIGRTPEFLFEKPERFEEFAREAVEVMFKEGKLRSEERGRKKDGTSIDVYVTVTSLGSAGAERGELLVTVEDITERKKAQRETEMALEAYSTIFATAKDALFVHNLEGNILDANEMATGLTGYEYGELLSMNVKDLVSPEKVAELYSERLREVLRNGSTAFQFVIQTKSGDRIPAEAEARLTTIWGETVIISSVRDIRERVKAELEAEKRMVQLEILNELMRAATSTMDLEVTGASICEVMINNSEADDGALLMMHYDESKISAVVPHGSAIKYPPSLSGVAHINSFGALIEEAGEALIIEAASFSPGTIYHDILSPFYRESFAEVLVVPLKSGDRPVGLILLGARKIGAFHAEDFPLYEAIGREIGIAIDNLLVYIRLYNEHERLSALLRSAQHISGEAELRAVLKATVEDAAFTVGANAALIAMKKDDSFYLFPATAGDVSVLNLTELSAPVDCGIGVEALTMGRALSAGWETADLPEIKDELLRKIGTRTAVAVPLISGKNALGFLLVCDPAGGREVSPEDIRLLEALGRQAAVAIEKARLLDDARKNLEALENANRELMSLDRMKSEFVSTVSHELRAPLAVIGGFAKTLVEHFDKIDRETERESIEIILNKTLALEELVENLLDMSRLEGGRLEVEIEPIDIVAVCDQIKKDQDRVLETHEIILDAPEEGVVVLADRDKARVCVNNLVSNAVKFSPGGGRVIIRVSRKEGFAEISVSDNGIGIPPEEQEKIFDKFYQVESGETRGFPGSGLGLHITRELVRAMGGDIWVKSKPGEGSTFTFTLPLSQ